MTKQVAIFGATSAIAQAVAKEYAQQEATLHLVARNQERLQIIADDLKVQHNGKINTHVLDMNAVDQHEALLNDIGQCDVAVIAHGTLSDQAACEASVTKTLEEFNTNCLSYLSLLTLLGNQFEKQGSGSIVAITSVAGDRGRQSNYVYGSAKAAVSAFMSGLRNRLAKKGVQVLTVKPGFVDTPMTADLKKGALWATPEKVAKDILKAIDKERNVLYTPWFWLGIMTIVKLIPECIFKKLSM